MPDYDLSRLNSRSFEQLVQALAVGILGPGLVIFGDGPDGGREATFDHKVPYPSEVETWDGYCVVQAKFLQRPKNTHADGTWAVAELKSELEKYLEPRGTRKVPEYYLFVTNAVLSAVQDKGAKDRVVELLEEYKDRLSLKGFDVWDYDKLRVFLDNNADVRQLNEAWITPGDVLASIIRRLDLDAINFDETINAFLEKELLNDQHVNLQQAGHRHSDGIPLAQVFVDLETVDEVQGLNLAEFQQANRVLIEDDSTEHPKRGFIREIVDLAAEHLNHQSLESGLAGPTALSDSPQPSRNRFVLVGGPGQGKSTVGQFICQIFRSTIVSSSSSHNFLPETSKAIALIKSHCEEENIDYKIVPRFPFRVTLSQFATALSAVSSTNVSSIFSYLSYQIRRRTGDEVSVKDLKTWFAKYPAILIFDGLDEVPSSSNRDQVLEAIQDFWVDVSRLDADVLAIATSRPQGYNNEFLPTLYQHRWLTPLTNQHALHFGQRLVEVRYGSDIDRKERVLERLKRAIDDNPTSRLMRSPLQVTIMTALVDQMGRPPSGRWNLFDSYYEVIYQREMERDIPASEILRQFRPNIDAIHNRVGLVLQIASEQKGKTDSWFSAEKFRLLVKARLYQEGHKGESLKSLTDKIADAALERLVFLVGVEADQVGFEIRSLQEFMAAECLMDVGDVEAELRLREIAPLPNWRNVFLFAAGKIFSKREHMRGMVNSLCSVLNGASDDKVAGTYLAGSDLAMSLLEDGLAQNMPNFTESFSRVALAALDAPNDRFHMRLAGVYDPAFEAVYRDEISRRLNDGRENHQLGAWCCLLNLIAAETEWAQDLAEEFWPSDPVAQFNILSLWRRIGGSKWALRRLVEVMPSIEVSRLRQMPMALVDGEGYLEELSGEQTAAINFVRRGLHESQIPMNFLGFRLQYSPLVLNSADQQSWILQMQKLTVGHPSWSPAKAGARFLSDPCKRTLAEELRTLAFEYYPEMNGDDLGWSSAIPWPLLACMKACTDRDSVLGLADKAERGELGDIDQWKAAEDRWLERGVTAEDISSMSDDRVPFDREIDSRGFPVTLPLWPYLPADDARVRLIDNLLDLHSTLDDSESRRFVARAIALSLIYHAITENHSEIILPNNLSIRSLRSVYEDLQAVSYIPLSMILELISDNNEETTEFFAAMAQRRNVFPNYAVRRNMSEEKLSLALRLFTYSPEKANLLPVMEALARNGLLHGRHVGELSPDDFPHTEQKVAAFVISLAQESWTTDRSTLLMQSFSRIGDGGEDTLDSIISTLFNSRFSGPWYDAFVVQLGTAIPIEMYSTRRHYWELLEDSLGRRTSNFGDMNKSTMFKLPIDLIELLVN